MTYVPLPSGAVAPGTGLKGGLDTPLQRSASPAPASAQTLTISHREFRRMLRKVVPADAAEAINLPAPAPPPPLAPHRGLSKPLEPLGAAEVARLDAAAQARKFRT